MTQMTFLSQRLLLLAIACWLSPDLYAQTDLGRDVLAVFENRCAKCHGGKAAKDQKSYRRFSSVDDLAKLRQNLDASGQPYKKKLVDTATHGQSQLLAKAVGKDADMPQNDDGDYEALPEAEQEVLKSWFAAGMPLPGKAAQPDKPPPSGSSRLVDKSSRKTLVGETSTVSGGKRIENSIGMIMLPVAADPDFVMGSPDDEVGRYPDENQHKAPVSRAFWLAETEVTQAQWRRVMGTTPWAGKSSTQEGDTVAATHVSWDEAQDFCRKLTARDLDSGKLPAGHEYRLPKETEWELACRGGTKTRYSFGDDEGRLGEFAVFLGSREGSFAHPVKSRKANPLGFFDMHGNVSEWCDDLVKGRFRGDRGGSWFNSASRCRSADLSWNMPGDHSRSLGFRPALAASSDK